MAKTPRPCMCGGCQARWGGNATCHRSGCHHTFGSLKAFDRHLAFDNRRRVRRDIDPATDPRFSLTERGYWSWAASLASLRAAFPGEAGLPPESPNDSHRRLSAMR
jgi:hypothetical protein